MSWLKRFNRAIGPKPTIVVHDGHVITLDWGWRRSQFLLDNVPFFYMGDYGKPGNSYFRYERETTDSAGATVTYMIHIRRGVFANRIIIERFPEGTYCLDDPGETVYRSKFMVCQR